MKVLLLNGSPHTNGNTALALAELEKTFAACGVEAELIQVGSKPLRGCLAFAGRRAAARQSGGGSSPETFRRSAPTLHSPCPQGRGR